MRGHSLRVSRRRRPGTAILKESRNDLEAADNDDDYGSSHKQSAHAVGGFLRPRLRACDLRPRGSFGRSRRSGARRAPRGGDEV